MSVLQGNLLYVTPEEFSHIHGVCQLSEDQYLSIMKGMYGCQPGNDYEVIVCYDWRSFSPFEVLRERSTDDRRPKFSDSFEK